MSLFDVILSLLILHRLCSKKTMSFIFKLPSADRMDRIVPLTRMALKYVDLLVQGELNPRAKAKAAEHRREADTKKLKETYQQRQEADQARKTEKLRKQREALKTEEDRAKFEEKQKKREMKKKMSGKQMKIALG
jgi:hypothetical protein